jgi:putative NADH-flavin reductase
MNEQVTVFGANGRVGRRVVAELVNRGYSVVAFVHGDSHFVETPQLKVFRGDIYTPDAVERALTGSSIVISALGSWGTPKKDILAVGMGHIIPAMRQHGISRIVSLTGADARAPGDSLGFIHKLTHLILVRAMPRILADGERHIELLEQSGLDWTVVRSPIMVKRHPRHDRHALGTKRPLPWQVIPYQLVALAIVDAAQGPTWIQEAPFITWRP